MALPVNAQAYDFYISVSDALDPSQFLADPTIAAGDFQISIDGSSFSNLATLPVVDPAASITVLIALSATEMTGEKINVQGIDTATKEWQDILISLDVPAANTESLFDIQEGDHVESSTSLVINKKDTTDALIAKTISGSLLPTGITVSTTEP